MYRTLLGILASLLAALLLVGMTFSSSVEAEAGFRFINGTEPKTLDPHLATGEPEGRILMNVFEGLMRLDARSNRPVGGVAERWKISPDEMRYEFTLRKNAKWTDGHPVTAEDFVYAWKRILDPKLGGQYAYILHGVRGARAYNTFGGHVAQLRGPITKGVTELLARGASGVSASDWQAFLAKHKVSSPLEQTRDELLRALLSRRKGRVSREELVEFGKRIAEEARRLDAEYKKALSRFGKDWGIFAPDAHTFVVELESPLPYFFDILTFYPTMPAPRWVVEQEGNARDWFMPDKIVSNGPFRLEKWTVNDRIRLVKNETYWDKDSVKSDTIDAYAMENVTTSLNMYLTGEVDWVPKQYPEELSPQLRDRDDFYVGPAMVVYYYQINCTRPPLDNPKVRKALNLAIDRTEITRDVLGRGEVPAAHMVPPGMPGYTPPKSEVRFDVPAARKLLAEAGFEGGKGFPEIGILFNTFEAHRKIAEVIADQLRRHLNLKVEAYNQEWQSYLATRRALDYDVARAAWVGDYRDPNTFLDMWLTNSGNNDAGFSSADYDFLVRSAGNVGQALTERDRLIDVVDDKAGVRRLIAESQAGDLDAQKAARARLRMALMREAEAILVQKEFPIIPIYFYVNSGLIDPKVRGFYSTLELPDGSKVPNLQDRHPLYSIEKVH